MFHFRNQIWLKKWWIKQRARTASCSAFWKHKYDTRLWTRSLEGFNCRILSRIILLDFPSEKGKEENLINSYLQIHETFEQRFWRYAITLTSQWGARTRNVSANHRSGKSQHATPDIISGEENSAPSSSRLSSRKRGLVLALLEQRGWWRSFINGAKAWNERFRKWPWTNRYDTILNNRYDALTLYYCFATGDPVFEDSAFKMWWNLRTYIVHRCQFTRNPNTASALQFALWIWPLRNRQTESYRI